MLFWFTHYVNSLPRKIKSKFKFPLVKTVLNIPLSLLLFYLYKFNLLSIQFITKDGSPWSSGPKLMDI